MPQTSPSHRRKSTTSTSTAGTGASSASSRKRKRTASTTPASPPPNSSKRIKTETSAPTEPKLAKSVGKVSDSIYDTIIDFKIGESLTSFGIHRGLLWRTSSFFKEKLSISETTEGGIAARSIVMKNEDPDVFRRFTTWLYSKTIILESENYKTLPWEVIIQTYSFAERTMIPGLQNTCVDTVIKKRRDGGLFPAQGAVNTLWRYPGKVFRLRRLLLDLFATECNLSNALANNGSYHPRFLQGLVLTLYEMKGKRTMYNPVDFWQKRVNYYVDDNENPIPLD
ncbi:hypothetical protein HO133_006855 [Letharia lupina]|uniref:BTB domain-containing protein n=1 Tax=Letharia lupina TaxID=560253 RepID=A0A8H6C5G8_9LECA|nr:uncharacterized protein HO133_006855 [Letharia lupina]KAF6217517.1 hypothetical protein HO133_006855 [Letharia lupina]